MQIHKKETNKKSDQIVCWSETKNKKQQGQLNKDKNQHPNLQTRNSLNTSYEDGDFDGKLILFIA